LDLLIVEFINIFTSFEKGKSANSEHQDLKLNILNNSTT